ncbi:MAG: histidine kinase [Bacteroides sp.]|nr:histidine kinase [Bacteroides sp.]MCM1096372.1 hypothetical protein [Terasakiella sp.]
MSEQERIELWEKLQEGFRRATIKMLTRKIKLGESVVVADENGQPLIISAEEALQRYFSSDN